MYIYTHTPNGNINAVPGNVNLYTSSYLNTVTIHVRTHMPSGNINTVPLNINVYAQWLPEYGCNRDTYVYAQWLC